MVGIMLLVFLVFMIGVGSVAKMSQSSKVTIKSNSVLKTSLAMPIGERGQENPFEDLDLPIAAGPAGKVGLDDIKRAFSQAKDDASIKGIYLDISGMSAGWAQSEDIRNALLDFKESGKFIIAYGEGISQKAYYVASVADKIYLNPSGILELKGFAAELQFFKNALEKLEVEPVIFYAGKFKSATEPFRLTAMSEANKEQTKVFLEDFYDNFLEKVAIQRGKSEENLNDIIDNLKIREAEDAVTHGMVDEVIYEDAVYDKIRENIGLDSEEKINFVSLQKYTKTLSKSSGFGKDKIAVVYADGNIVDGKGTIENIGSDRFKAILQKIRRDDKVKALVMRVNSGGGSALASDIIWNEIEQFKEKGIPVVTSMSNYAASGGYYIAANSNKIFAERTTLTGSIGVFGMLFDMDEFYNNKLGITFDNVKTTQYSDFPTSALLSGDLTELEKAVIQNSIDKIYIQFKQRVADGRNMTMEQVEEVAQGRVWTGKQAVEQGLVDELGDLDDAIAHAAELAGMDDYRESSYPRKKDAMQQILDKLSGKEEDLVSSYMANSQFAGIFKQYKAIEDLVGSANRAQMKMPFTIEIK